MMVKQTFFFEDWQPNAATDVKAFFYTDDEGRLRYAGGPGSGGGTSGGTSSQGFYRTTKKQEATLRSAESGIMAKPIEECFAVNQKGEVIFTKTGEKSEIRFTDEEIPLFENTVFTHNHPSGRAFSPEDIFFAVRCNMSSVRAVGIDYVGIKHLYQMNRPADGWPEGLKSWTRFMAIYNVHSEKELDINWPLINSGKLTIEEANAVHGHHIMTEIANAYGLGYSRTEL